MTSLNIQTQQFSADQKLIDLINRKIERLDEKFQRIIDITVFLRIDSKRSQVKDKVVEIRANLPGFQAFSKQVDRNFEKALDLSLRKIKRQLRDAKNK